MKYTYIINISPAFSTILDSVYLAKMGYDEMACCQITDLSDKMGLFVQFYQWKCVIRQTCTEAGNQAISGDKNITEN